MTSLTPNSEANLRDLFYRCQNSELVKHTENLQTTGAPHDFVYRIAALFELHRLNLIQKVFELVDARQIKVDHDSPDYFHLLGRVAYQREKYQEAEQYFSQLLQSSADIRHQVKALMGLANIQYSQKNPVGMSVFLDRLADMDLQDFPDLMISHRILQGNFLLQRTALASEAKNAFLSALNLASLQGWLYFMQRAMYGLAIVAKKMQTDAELKCILSLLRNMVDPQESVYFCYVLNRDFSEDSFEVASPIIFDDKNLRIKVREQWLAFHDRPLIFRFLRVLSENQQFVQKEELVSKLWPGESYHPGIHDMRIYDLARRARTLVEAFDEQPVILLSGRSGYKLSPKPHFLKEREL